MKLLYLAIGINLASAVMSAGLTYARLRRLRTQRDYWQGLFIRSLPFVMAITYGPLKRYVSDEIVDRGKALLPEPLVDDIRQMEAACEAMRDRSRDGTIN